MIIEQLIPMNGKHGRVIYLFEMASLELMPHTVNQFLKQVHSGLWDGTSLAMNAEHVMLFGPQYTSTTSATAASDNGDDAANVME